MVGRRIDTESIGAGTLLKLLKFCQMDPNENRIEHEKRIAKGKNDAKRGRPPVAGNAGAEEESGKRVNEEKSGIEPEEKKSEEGESL